MHQGRDHQESHQDLGYGRQGSRPAASSTPSALRVIVFLRCGDAMLLLSRVALAAGRFLLPILLILAVCSLSASLLQNLPRFVLDRITPKWSRVSPMAGFARIFGTSGQVEFLKSLVKFLSVSVVALLLLRSERTRAVNAMFVDPSQLPELILTVAIRLVSAVAIATIVIVAGDLVWARLRWQRSLRMSHQDIKDEHKQTEGDPSVKARLRSLAQDRAREIRAVCVVHNETSTGVTSDVAAVRRAIDAAGHPALLLVDTISSLGSVDYRHDEWGVDVTVAGSQKGLMLPPGLSFNAVSAKAVEASRRATLPKAYWGWEEILAANESGFWPYTPATNLLYGLSEAIDMLLEEGLPEVFARHQRHAEATRRAVAAWGLEVLCRNPSECSPALTAVLMPNDASGKPHDADALRAKVLERFDMSLGTGLGKLKGRMFRIGHLGEANDLSLMATLSGCEMGLKLAGVQLAGSGVNAAMEQLMAGKAQASRQAA